MCGLTGFVYDQGGESESLKSSVIRMTDRLGHRGPDDTGVWTDEKAGVAFGHKRLAIIDASPAGHQPMLSPSGRYVLTFNGEIYNHQELRRELDLASDPCSWNGRSDTESLLAAIDTWGLKVTLEKLNGMFAFALWDRHELNLYLVRDRFGEKPLYYGRVKTGFIFGSELKAITAHPDWLGSIDRDALALFMRYGYVPAPHSVYKGIKKLPPAHLVVVSNQGQTVSEPVSFWSLANAASEGVMNRGEFLPDLVDELDLLLRDAVKLRMLSDVPVGAFLSGGYDSTLIVAQMQAQSSRPVRTFSIGNEQAELDEARHAAAVATLLGTDHTDLYITPKDALSIIPRLPYIYDEPFADSSQIPTFLVSQLARSKVMVALSGDGGDELFAGYNRHVEGVKLWTALGKFPKSVRLLLSQVISRLDSRGNTQLVQFLGRKMNVPELGLKLSKFGAALRAANKFEFYDLLKAQWKFSSVVLGASPVSGCKNSVLDGAEFLDQMLLMDLQTYLPDDILTKVDRATMAVSLEARVPFLDHRLVEFAWRVPSNLKIKNNQGKWLLRQVLHRYVPHELMDRPKQGFDIPVAQWLRGPLRDWGESLLDRGRLEQEGFLQADIVRSSWERHLGGGGHEEHKLWNALMFQAWLTKEKNF
jgi:asparagine synthase (glutamine-hydrolysing)